MPATQIINQFNGLEIRVDVVDEPDPVYFTSDEPRFDISFKNNGSDYQYSEDSKFRWTIETNPQHVVHTGVEEIGQLDYGEETMVRVGGRVLAYEGHSVIGISIGGASGKSGSERRQLKAGRGRQSHPAYSFSVWDESDYVASVKRPKQLQIALVATSIVLILFAAVQVLIATGVLG